MTKDRRFFYLASSVTDLGMVLFPIPTRVKAATWILYVIPSMRFPRTIPWVLELVVMLTWNRVSLAMQNTWDQKEEEEEEEEETERKKVEE